MHLVQANVLISFKETVCSVVTISERLSEMKTRAGHTQPQTTSALQMCSWITVTCFSVIVGWTVQCIICSPVTIPGHYYRDSWKWMSVLVHASAHLMQTLRRAIEHSCQRPVFGFQKSWISRG